MRPHMGLDTKVETVVKASAGLQQQKRSVALVSSMPRWGRCCLAILPLGQRTCPEEQPKLSPRSSRHPHVVERVLAARRRLRCGARGPRQVRMVGVGRWGVTSAQCTDVRRQHDGLVRCVQVSSTCGGGHACHWRDGMRTAQCSADPIEGRSTTRHHQADAAGAEDRAGATLWPDEAVLPGRRRAGG